MVLPNQSESGKPMLLTLRQQLVKFAHLLQDELFPNLEAATGELSETAQHLIAVLAMIPLRRFLPVAQGWNGRPSKDRYAIACAFVAKAVYHFPTTRDLVDRLHSDEQLLRICGWTRAEQLPHESTFSRAFTEFAEMELPQFVHEALIRETQKDRLIGHIARDSTAIEAREHSSQAAPAKAAQPAASSRRRTGPHGPHKRWKGGKPRRAPKENTRLHRQRTMSLEEMLRDLPRQCDTGAKTSGDGHPKYWQGYKLHLDVADGQIPISAILTSASLHDSQAAIPLTTMTSQRVIYCYDLMDAAYDAQEILDHCRSLGHVPIADPANRGRKTKNVIVPAATPRELSWAEQERYKERTMIERINGRLKDEFGACFVRVRGAVKVMTHLMFGVLALTADQLLRLGYEES